MRIGQIKKLVMEEKNCVILNGERGQQWIGGEKWIVRVDDAIRINTDSLKGLFDISQEQADKITVEALPMETYAVYPELRRTMNEMTPSLLDIGNFGGLVTLIFENSVYFAEKKLIRAAIAGEDYREYKLAKNRFGEPLITVWDGFIMTGVVRPENRIMTRKILQMLGGLAAMKPGGTDADVTEDDADGEQQLSMDSYGEGGSDGETA